MTSTQNPFNGIERTVKGILNAKKAMIDRIHSMELKVNESLENLEKLNFKNPFNGIESSEDTQANKVKVNTLRIHSMELKDL